MSKFNKQVGSNNSGEDGKKFIYVGEKTKRLEIFLNIIINGEAQITVGRMENFLKSNKRVYPSIYLRPKSKYILTRKKLTLRLLYRFKIKCTYIKQTTTYLDSAADCYWVIFFCPNGHGSVHDATPRWLSSAR